MQAFNSGAGDVAWGKAQTSKTASGVTPITSTDCISAKFPASAKEFTSLIFKKETAHIRCFFVNEIYALLQS